MKADLIKIKKLLATETGYAISKATGINETTIQRWTSGKTDIENIKFKFAAQLTELYDQIKGETNMNTNEIKLNALTIHTNYDYTVSHLTVSDRNLIRNETPITSDILDYFNDELVPLLTAKVNEWIDNKKIDMDQDDKHILMDIEYQLSDYLDQRVFDFGDSIGDKIEQVREIAQKELEESVLEMCRDYFNEYAENLDDEELEELETEQRFAVHFQPSDRSLWVEFWGDAYIGDDRNHFECADLTLMNN